MELEEVLHYFNPWWEAETSPPGIPRPRYLSLLDEEAKRTRVTLVTGLRQVGKTTLMRQHLHAIARVAGRDHVLFLSMEHPELKDARLYDVLDAFRKLHGLKRSERIYAYLDEVTYKEGMAQDLKVVHDNEDVKLFVSSSSAAGLRDEGAFLTGRTRTIELEPLSFWEFLHFTGREASPSERYLLESHFEEYLRYGGMPEYVLTRDPEVVLGLVSDVIERDIIARHDIRDEASVFELFQLLCERVGKRMTFNRLARILGVKPDTVKSYVGHLERNFLFHTVPRYARRLGERIRCPRKVYVADVGLRNVYTGFRDLGALYENLVYLSIRGEVLGYVSEGGVELDFMTKEGPVEAKYGQDLSEGQRALLARRKGRVVEGLDHFMGNGGRGGRATRSPPGGS
jgi:predicted AAA+ superfamily ATPase